MGGRGGGAFKFLYRNTYYSNWKWEITSFVERFQFQFQYLSVSYSVQAWGQHYTYVVIILTEQVVTSGDQCTHFVISLTCRTYNDFNERCNNACVLFKRHYNTSSIILFCHAILINKTTTRVYTLSLYALYRKVCNRHVQALLTSNLHNNVLCYISVAIKNWKYILAILYKENKYYVDMLPIVRLLHPQLDNFLYVNKYCK